MPAPVVVRGKVDFADIERGFEGVRARVQKINEQIVKDSQRTADRKTRVTRAGVDNELKEVERWLKGSEKREQQRTKAAEREQQRQTKAVEREAARRMKINEASAKYAGRVAEREAKEVERAEQRKTKAAEREAARRMRLNEQSARMAGRLAAQEAAQDARIRASRMGTVTSAIGRAGRSTWGTVAGVGGMMGLAGGSMLVGNAVMGGLNLQRQAALLSNATSVGGNAGMSPAELIAMARSTAMATGFGASNVMESMNVVAARGGPKALQDFKKDLSDVAKTAIASGTSIEDMGAVYAAAFKAGVQPGQEMQQLMRDLVAQGKEGAVEFADLAQELAKLAGAGKSWGSGADMIRRASGLAQIAVEAAVSPEESRTAVVDMVREFSQGPKLQALKNAGIKVEGVGGKNRDPADLLSEIITRAETKGIGKHGYKGQAALSEIFSGKSQEAIVRNLRETYLTGYKSDLTGRTYTGKDAVRQRIIDSSSSTMTAEQRDQEFQKVMSTDMQKIAVAMERFGGEMDKLLPQITAMIPNLLKLTEAFGGLAVKVAENPVAGIGALLVANIGKELAGAGLGAAVKAAIGGVNNTIAGGGANFVGPGGLAGNAAALGAITLTAATVYLAGRTIMDAGFESGKAEGKNTYSERIAIENELRATSGATPEGRAKLQSLMERAQGAGGGTGLQPQWWDALAATPLLPAVLGAHALQMVGNKEGEAGAMSQSDLLAAIAEKMGAAADKQAAAADKLSSVSLPNQTGTPTSRTATSPLMK